MCNHPELFERADVIASLAFSRFGQSGQLSREGNFVALSYSSRNPIELPVPSLFYHDGILDFPSKNSHDLLHGGPLSKLYNIWSTNWIQRSLYDTGEIYWQGVSVGMSDFA